MRRLLPALILSFIFVATPAVEAAPPKLQAAKPAQASAAPKRTVCTITVNSADEKEVFRRYLPASQYNFVELVEKGRPDWLASSCRAATSCDVLIISGHFDGDNEFFSDRIEAREFLTVAEMERASCSNSCPTLFSKLKEVYLFGCNSLNSQPQSSVSADTVHEFVSDGRSDVETDRQLRMLSAAHGQSSLERMRQLFAGVPVLYGFSSTAPLGPIAAGTLSGYFRSQGTSRIATGRSDPGLLRAFSTFSMASAAGLTPGDPRMADRNDMCKFVDDRITLAGRVDFVHEMLQRPSGDAKRYLDRINRVAASLDDKARAQPDVAQALNRIATDQATRERFLADERDAAQAPTRVRMVRLARDLGWLTEDQSWQELALMLGQLQDRKAVGIAEIDLACQLNHGGELDGAFAKRVAGADDVPHAALRACLGSAEGRATAIAGLASSKPADVEAAQAYLRRRPISEPQELRELATHIAQMPAGDLQVRALETLGRHYVADPEVLTTLTQLYAQTPSPQVQNAVAGVLLRADRSSVNRNELLHTIIVNRKGAKGGGGEMVEALMARLDAP